MIRRALTTLALTALVAAPAVAQSPWQENFTFHNFGAPDSYDRYTGTFASDPSDVFQVFCVDPTKHVGQNQVYTGAWVTPLSSGNSTHTQNYNNTWNAQYQLAAQVASGLTTQLPVGTGSGLSANDVRQYQYAIWTAMGFSVNDGQTWTGYDATTVNGILATAAGITIFPNQWLVITDANKKYQEFLTYDPDRPQETVPEPATMTLLATGLAGLAAAKRRRNKAS